MRAIDLALKDLIQLLRDWKTAMFLVVMPVVFTLMFGFAFGGFGGGEQDPRLPVGFVDQDGGHPLSASLLSLLTASDLVRPEALEGKEAKPDQINKAVRDEDLVAVVVVPAGYSDMLLTGEPVPLQVVLDQASTAGLSAQGAIQAAASRVAEAVQAARLSLQAYEERAAALPDEIARRQFLQEAAGQAITTWADPPLSVRETESGAFLQEESSDVMESGFSHTSPSMMVQFSIAGLIGAASILLAERKSRALRRLLTTAISRVEIILGHYLAMVVLILGQLVILVAFGQFLLGVPYLRQPLATLLVMVATALWTAALGLLIGTLARSEDQVIIFSLVPMFVLAGMGGAWVPLEFTGRTFQRIGHLLPTAWAMDGFENLVVRGMGLESVLLPVGVMLVYALVLFALAAWRFRYE